jgi:hypothetical protein
VSPRTQKLQLRGPQPGDLEGYRELFLDEWVERWLPILPEPRRFRSRLPVNRGDWI